jgi:CRP-like cAMP-binding protein
LTPIPLKHPLWSNLFRDRHDWVKRTCLICEDSPLFANIPQRSIDWLASRMHVRHYVAGEIIFHMGDPGVGAVFVLSGEVLIRAHDVELAVLQEGDVFGEVALATTTPRTAEAVAVTHSELVFFLRSDLKEWMDTSPKQASILLVNLANMLAHRLLKSNEQCAKSQSLTKA